MNFPSRAFLNQSHARLLIFARNEALFPLTPTNAMTWRQRQTKAAPIGVG
jgi:hypothetical protein